MLTNANVLLAKGSPVAKILLAAHWNKKRDYGILKAKARTAFRIYSHMMLGATRAYSRKAELLLQDCEQLSAEMKHTCRRDISHMFDILVRDEEDAMNAVTLPQVFHELDIMPDLK